MLARFWRWLLDWIAPEQAPAFTPPRIAIDLPAFNWLADYGPHWEPDSLAFWLEPRKESDLIAWLRKYRPDFVGEFEAAGLAVTVEERPALEAWRPALLNAYANDPRYFQSGAYLAQQLALQQMQAAQAQAQFQQGLLNSAMAQRKYQSNHMLGLGSMLGRIINP